jgi:hypothetical protein
MTPENQPPDYPLRDPQMFYELARDRLATQLSMLSAVDSKIALLVSFASGLLGLLAAVLALSTPKDEVSLSLPHLGLLVAAAVPYAYAAFKGIRAYRAREWSVGPKLGQVMKTMEGSKDDARVKWGLATDFWTCYFENRVAYEAKSDALQAVFLAVVIQTGLVVLALALVGAGV